LENPNWLDTVRIVLRDTVTGLETVAKIKRAAPTQAGRPETVYIEIPCPDQEVEVEVPTGITTKISAGYTLWKIIQALLAGFVVGVLLTLLYTAIKK
jgi:hypothetical protein